MSQTPTQRRREIDDARRRMLNGVLEQLAIEHPARRGLAEQLAGAIGLFGSDELELVDRMVTALLTRRYLGGVTTQGTILCIAAVVSRLLRGRAEYGELTLASDPRDYALERDEELADAILYEAMERLRMQRDGADYDEPVVMRTDASIEPLAIVGAHVEHSTLAALVQRVQDAERPTPFVLPAPWCLGSAMLFQHGAVRIENNTIVAVRCHHCGREWPLSSTELRRTGSGQYVIPTHKGRRA